MLARKDHIREIERNGTERHLARLRSGEVASIETSALHLDIVRDLKRINWHLASVAYPILDQAGVLRNTRLRRRPKADARQPGDRSKAGAGQEQVLWAAGDVEGEPHPAP